MRSSVGRIFLSLLFLAILGEVTARLCLWLALGASSIENVIRAADAHNEVVRHTAGEHPGVFPVEQAVLMPQGRVYFNDVWHLTATGSEISWRTS